MPNLYTKLARVYHAIYPHIFNYEREFKFYRDALVHRQCRSVLELGCGTGLLAKYFLDAGYDYLGIDLQEEMLAIARETNSTGTFRQGDMRHLNLQRVFDAVLLTGKSVSHLLANSDVLACFARVHAHLVPEGLFIFDAYDASTEYSHWISEGEEEIVAGGKSYYIQGTYTQLLDTGWTARWDMTYTLPSGEQVPDSMVIRSFTVDELHLFLALSQFKVTGSTPFAENVVLTISQRAESL